jgi:hypothetical protein
MLGSQLSAEEVHRLSEELEDERVTRQELEATLRAEVSARSSVKTALKDSMVALKEQQAAVQEQEQAMRKMQRFAEETKVALQEAQRAEREAEDRAEELEARLEEALVEIEVLTELGVATSLEVELLRSRADSALEEQRHAEVSAEVAKSWAQRSVAELESMTAAISSAEAAAQEMKRELGRQLGAADAGRRRAEEEVAVLKVRNGELEAVSTQIIRALGALSADVSSCVDEVPVQLANVEQEMGLEMASIFFVAEAERVRELVCALSKDKAALKEEIHEVNKSAVRDLELLRVENMSLAAQLEGALSAVARAAQDEASSAREAAKVLQEALLQFVGLMEWQRLGMEEEEAVEGVLECLVAGAAMEDLQDILGSSEASRANLIRRLVEMSAAAAGAAAAAAPEFLKQSSGYIKALEEEAESLFAQAEGADALAARLWEQAEEARGELQGESRRAAALEAQNVELQKQSDSLVENLKESCRESEVLRERLVVLQESLGEAKSRCMFLEEAAHVTRTEAARLRQSLTLERELATQGNHEVEAQVTGPLSTSDLSITA